MGVASGANSYLVRGTCVYGTEFLSPLTHSARQLLGLLTDRLYCGNEIKSTYISHKSYCCHR